jgi:prevent-host-death family protein
MAPACETYTASEARERLSEILDKAHYRGPVVIRRRNQAFAVIPYELLVLLTTIEAECDIKEAKKALAEYHEKGGYTLKQIKDELGME